MNRLSLKISTLQDICENVDPRTPSGYLTKEYAVRWEDDELASDLLEIQTDPEATLPVEIEVNDLTYTVMFTEVQLKDVVAINAASTPQNAPAADVALRFYLEFDGFLTEHAHHSVKPRKYKGRSAKDFLKVWLPDRLTNAPDTPEEPAPVQTPPVSDQDTIPPTPPQNTLLRASAFGALIGVILGLATSGRAASAMQTQHNDGAGEITYVILVTLIFAAVGFVLGHLRLGPTKKE